MQNTNLKTERRLTMFENFAWWGWLFAFALPYLIPKWLREREEIRIDGLVSKYGWDRPKQKGGR